MLNNVHEHETRKELYKSKLRNTVVQSCLTKFTNVSHLGLQLLLDDKYKSKWVSTAHWPLWNQRDSFINWLNWLPDRTVLFFSNATINITVVTPMHSHSHTSLHPVCMRWTFLSRSNERVKVWLQRHLLVQNESNEIPPRCLYSSLTKYIIV